MPHDDRYVGEVRFDYNEPESFHRAVVETP
jgi:hypothetical protein